jgi:cyclic beta-1,2-glucan synthetase
VTHAADTAARATTAEAIALATRARALAARQRDLERCTSSRSYFVELARLPRALEYAQRHLASMPTDDATLPRAAEWFLDNYYLLRRVARQVEEELPRGFIHHLPQLATGSATGCSRIDVFARDLVVATSVDLDAATLRCFVDAYQEVEPLTIAELWALPTMLRTTVLRHLVRFLDELHIPIRGDGDRREQLVSADDQIALDPGVGIERSIRALRVLDVIDWKAFFEQTNPTAASSKLSRGTPAVPSTRSPSLRSSSRPRATMMESAAGTSGIISSATAARCSSSASATARPAWCACAER